MDENLAERIIDEMSMRIQLLASKNEGTVFSDHVENVVNGMRDKYVPKTYRAVAPPCPDHLKIHNAKVIDKDGDFWVFDDEDFEWACRETEDRLSWDDLVVKWGPLREAR